ncbi:MAG: hypothetical protein IJQ12_01275 [Lachnospiraceae bacterium]|nr:hypothetical protein [Lachnospiraceae bacterium]
MHYQIVVFGVKDTSEEIIGYIRELDAPLTLVVTVSDAVKGRNEISGVASLKEVCTRHNITLFEADSYTLDDEKTASFFADNTFDLGICMGWQRLIPKAVLDRFRHGVFGFHGNAGYLPFGRGRSPLNWSILLGDTRFNLNLFRYDEHADSPNVFATTMFQITPHDDIRTAQYKNMIAAKKMIADLIGVYLSGDEIKVRTESKDFDSWYEKRTAADGKIDWHARTREIHNLIRAVSRPFPGAWCEVRNAGDLECPHGSSTSQPQPSIRTKHSAAESVICKVWSAQPFDEMLDFSSYAPGEIIDVFDGRPVVRTVDGSLLITEYECEIPLQKGMVLS